MEQKVILSGIQSTGHLTLGNYLGAIHNWLNMQENYKCYYMIANSHSITVRNEPEILRENTFRILAQYIASRTKHGKEYIFHTITN